MALQGCKQQDGYGCFVLGHGVGAAVMMAGIFDVNEIQVLPSNVQYWHRERHGYL